jgi:hypothetical protein
MTEGNKIDLETLAELMDDDIREQLHSELAPCSPEEFLEAYSDAHRAKFAEEFGW